MDVRKHLNRFIHSFNANQKKLENKCSETETVWFSGQGTRLVTGKL